MKLQIALIVMLSVPLALAASPRKKPVKKAPPAQTTQTTTTTQTKVVTTKEEGSERTVSNVETETVSQTSLSLHPKRNVQREWFLRVTGSGGMSAVNSNDTRESDARSAAGYNRNPYGNLSVVGQWGRSAGAEVEGFISGGNSHIAASRDTVTGLIANRSRSISQNGVMVDAQMRIPVSSFRRDWGFHLGVGYGAAGVDKGAPVSLDSSVDNSKISVMGAYATLGVEVRVVPDISAGVDYATSFLTSSNRTITTSGTGATTNFQSGLFDRLRISAYYLVTTDWRVGLMYTRRLTKGTMADGSVDQEVGNQFLGSLQVIL